MSTKKITFIHNLPDGGGLRMFNKIIDEYHKSYDVSVYVIGEREPVKCLGVKTFFRKISPPKNFIFRQFYILLYLPLIHFSMSRIINKEKSLFFLSHDYLTKSPYMLRFLRGKKIYLCQEPQREFYESSKIHTSTLKEKILNIIRYPIKIIDEKNVKCSDLILCNSKYSKKVLEGIYKKKCLIVYPGVDTDYFCPISNTKKDNTILFVGGLNPVKDPLFMVKSLTPILNKYKIEIIGEGKVGYVEKLLSSPGGKNIFMYKGISDYQLRSMYQKSLVTCVTAHHEPFGLSSIESQSCGTPVVVVNEGGAPETVIDGYSGYISARDKKNFLEKVRYAIRNSHRLGQQARKNVIKRWSWKKTLRNLDKIIENELKDS